MKHSTELENYINKVKEFAIYDDTKNIELLKRYISGEKELLDEIFMMNALLVVKCINKFSSHIEKINFDIMDLVQIGNLVLLKAIKTYDFSYKTTFATWASMLIEREIKIAIYTNGYSVRFREIGFNRMVEYNQKYDKLSIELNREPTIEELADAMNLSKKKIIEIEKYKVRQTMASLNSYIAENGYELSNVVKDDQDDEYEKIDNKLSIKVTKESLLQIIKKVNLTDKEFKVIMLRYGFFDGKTKTQVEIAKELNVCKQFISYLEKNALKKIIKSDYIYELALLTDTPIDNLENIGYSKDKIKQKLDKLNKIW